jgi:hypothetical protein
MYTLHLLLHLAFDDSVIETPDSARKMDDIARADVQPWLMLTLHERQRWDRDAAQRFMLQAAVCGDMCFPTSSAQRQKSPAGRANQTGRATAFCTIAIGSCSCRVCRIQSCTTRRASSLCCCFSCTQRQKRCRRLMHAARTESWIGFAQRVILLWMHAVIHTILTTRSDIVARLEDSLRWWPLVKPPATDGASDCQWHEALRLARYPSSGPASGVSLSFASRRSPL